MKIQFKFISVAVVFLTVLMISCGGDKVANDGADKSKDSNVVAAPVKNVADVSGAKIAWANSDTVTKYYELALKMRTTLEGQQLEAQTTLENMYQSFEKKKNALEKEAPILGQNELQTKYQELQALEQKIMMTEQQLQMDLGNKEMMAQETFYNMTNEFMQKIGAELGYDYVFSVKAGGQIMYSNPDLDITQIIIQKLNQQYASHSGN